VSELGAERLRELLDYDPLTGVFTWRVRLSNRAPVGSSPRRKAITGYMRVRVGGRLYLAHRLAWLHVHGKWPDDEIDHINGDRADNRIANLRDVNSRQNKENRRAAQSNNKSCGLLGATWRKNERKWAGQITVRGRISHLGYFDSAEEAHAAYIAAKRVHHEGNTL
jgi:hypothetical protein